MWRACICGGRVARGGLRWSDRREDFRTEVLGLMKAQMVKNAVIVPVGAKGGFVLKRPPAGGDRAALMEEGVRCYKVFLRGLLDLTDDLAPSGVVPPRDAVRYDGDDPYLVVAADKGTATFSDYANSVSREYGFWLDDAFASGGSAGYDHKGMGITAKGAWELVKRHFRELGLDTQTQPFTVMGIGDMSGDVFGNGMLLSEQIRLVAAFDHRHIFLDPAPDPALSLAERKRLFNLPRSSWEDYDKALISPGGGVWPRSAKTVPIPPEARAVLGIEAESLSPAELMHAILKAPVDLFWNGGIGTYVKASTETHAEAQDRLNDSIRVNGADLRCRVVGEGGNLGCTQKGRVEFALRGGRINTDFIDNSAGVDCSDHEVNIKILLRAVMDAGELTLKQRDELLASMTDEVGELVLRDNVLQNLALSMTEALGPELLDAQLRLMRKLERQGRLDREVEDLPSDRELAERRKAGQGLSRPELAVLLSYAKMTLYEDLLRTELPERAYLQRRPHQVLPAPAATPLCRRDRATPPRREITATLIANSVVNRGLAVFVSELEDETGASLEEVLLAYATVRDSFGLLRAVGRDRDLPTTVPGDLQTRLLVAIARRRRARHTLVHHPGRAAVPDARRRGQVPTGHRDGHDQPRRGDRAAPCGRDRRRAGGVRERRRGRRPWRARSPACRSSSPRATSCAPRRPVAVRQACSERPASISPSTVLSTCPGCGGLLRAAPRRGRWDRLALTGLEDDISSHLRALTQAASSAGAEGADAAATQANVEAWLEREVPQLRRFRALLEELRQMPEPDLAVLSVAVRTLAELVPRGLDT